MATYKNDYSREEDELLWEIHNIRYKLYHEYRKKSIDKINKEALEKYNKWKVENRA